jgi:hypothetical protein
MIEVILGQLSRFLPSRPMIYKIQSLQNKLQSFRCNMLRAVRPDFDSQQRQGLFLFVAASRPALVSTQSPIQLVSRDITPKLKQTGLEANHSIQSSSAVNNVRIYTSTPPYVFMTWYLIKHRIRLSFPGGGWEFFSSPPRPERLWVPPNLLSTGYQEFFPWE